MVKFQARELDSTFAALSDPTRRAIVERLSTSEQLSVSALAEPFSMSLPGLMKHLDYLEKSGLLEREKRGRTVLCKLDGAPMEDAMAWLRHYEKFWTRNLDALAQYLEDEQCPDRSNQASHSSATSKQRRRKSTKPGRSRKA